MHRMDLFAAEMPKGNINGIEKVGTTVGFTLSMIMLASLLVYGTCRVIIFVKSDRPAISQYVQHNVRTNEDIVNLRDYNFKIAFAVQKNEQEDKSPIDDPNYVEWSVYWDYWDEIGGHRYETLNFHKCTEEDYSQFNPIIPQ